MGNFRYAKYGSDNDKLSIDDPNKLVEFTQEEVTAIKASVSGARKPQALVKPAGNIYTLAGVLGYSLSMTILVPQAFRAVRLRMYGASASAVINVTAGVAASANMAGASAGVSTGSPSQVTVGGATSWTLPAAVSGGDGTDEVFSTVVSDVIPVQSLARSDGGSGYLLMVRVFQPSAGNIVGAVINPIGNDAASVNAYGACGLAYSGDVTFSTWASASGPLNNYAPAVGVELFTDVPAASVAAFGDSTIGGKDSYKHNASGLVLAAVLQLAAGYPVGYWNAGEDSMQSTAYLKNLKSAITNGLPAKAVAFCGFSPNDSDKYTVAGTARQIASILEFIGICRASDYLPILVTPCPVGSLNATQEGYRRQVVEATKAFAAAHGTYLVDRDLIYTDYSTTSGGWLPGLNFNFVHPSPAGYALEAANLWAPVLRAVQT